MKAYYYYEVYNKLTGSKLTCYNIKQLVPILQGNDDSYPLKDITITTYRQQAVLSNPAELAHFTDEVERKLGLPNNTNPTKD